MMRDFECKDGVMMIAGKSAVELVEEFGSPIYVCDEARIRENYRNIHDAFPDTWTPRSTTHARPTPASLS